MYFSFSTENVHALMELEHVKHGDVTYRSRFSACHLDLLRNPMSQTGTDGFEERCVREDASWNRFVIHSRKPSVFLSLALLRTPDIAGDLLSYARFRKPSDAILL